MPKWRISVEFSLAAVMTLALYLADKGGKSGICLNTILLILMAGFLIHPTLNTSWVWPSEGIKALRAVSVIFLTLLVVVLFGIWTWPTSPNASSSAPVIMSSSLPITKLPVTELPITKLSPKEITDKVSAERPFQQKDVEDAFIGTPVDWELFFVAVYRFQDGIAYLTFSGPVYQPPFIFFEIPIKGHEYLRLVEKRERFRIKGAIRYVDLTSITLKNVSLERISDAKIKTSKQP